MVQTGNPYGIGNVYDRRTLLECAADCQWTAAWAYRNGQAGVLPPQHSDEPHKDNPPVYWQHTQARAHALAVAYLDRANRTHWKDRS